MSSQRSYSPFPLNPQLFQKSGHHRGHTPDNEGAVAIFVSVLHRCKTGRILVQPEPHPVPSLIVVCVLID